eukprot:537337_1
MLDRETLHDGLAGKNGLETLEELAEVIEALLLDGLAVLGVELVKLGVIAVGGVHGHGVVTETLLGNDLAVSVGLVLLGVVRLGQAGGGLAVGLLQLLERRHAGLGLNLALD